ncbi:hypothetical protein ACFRJ1_25965 [Streptomyces sp. NPDC056773]|uniref:hypothetical protein n=1 Tax=unclassified Streptomyces TaxID=2593676 RepID=UPI0036A0688F
MASAPRESPRDDGVPRREMPPEYEILLGRDAQRRQARESATRRVDADLNLARKRDEAPPHLVVTVLATVAFTVVGFGLARMTDGWWWTGPIAAALATAIAAGGYLRAVLRRPDGRARRPGRARLSGGRRRPS